MFSFNKLNFEFEIINFMSNSTKFTGISLPVNNALIEKQLNEVKGISIVILQFKQTIVTTSTPSLAKSCHK